MTTSIRPEISRRNQHHISKHRYYELKHFCLQYREWGNDEACNKELVKSVCEETDPSIAAWIFRAVTDGVSYTYLKTYLAMPCGKSMYYDRYRKFFWLLDIRQRNRFGEHS